MLDVESIFIFLLKPIIDANPLLSSSSIVENKFLLKLLPAIS